MLKKILSSGQTGANRAALDVAIARNFPYGGWLPRGRKTEEGPLSTDYLMQEMPRGGYPVCCLRNILDSDGTVILSHFRDSCLASVTQRNALEYGKPCLFLDLNLQDSVLAVKGLTAFIQENGVEALYVTGQSESKEPGIYQSVYALIDELLNFYASQDSG